MPQEGPFVAGIITGVCAALIAGWSSGYHCSSTRHRAWLDSTDTSTADASGLTPASPTAPQPYLLRNPLPRGGAYPAATAGLAAIPAGHTPAASVDEHHQVLPHLSRLLEAAAGPPADHREREPVPPPPPGHPTAASPILIHFDSHPDLSLPALPQSVVADLVSRRPGWARRLQPYTDIADWILPNVAAGILSEVVWVCPTWSTQFPVGTHSLRVVEMPPSSKRMLRVACQEEHRCDAAASAYFKGSQLWVGAMEAPFILRAFPFTLQVLRGVPGSASVMDEVSRIVSGRPYVLDVDQDYFVTTSPLHSSLPLLASPEDASMLRGMLLSDPSPSLAENMQAMVAANLSADSHLPAATYVRDQAGVAAAEKFTKWYRRAGPRLVGDVEMPSLVDLAVSLPHDVPGPQEVARRVEVFAAGLQRGGLGGDRHTPTALLVSRSQGYVPPGMSLYLDSFLAKALARVYPNATLLQPPVPLGHHAVYKVPELERFSHGKVVGATLLHAVFDSGDGVRTDVEWAQVIESSPELEPLL